MSFDLLDVVTGAIAALIVREAADARKNRLQLHAHDVAIVRGIRQELWDIRKVAEHNLKALREPEKFGPRRRSSSSRFNYPLYPLPARLDSLMRLDGGDALLTNSQVRHFLTEVVTTVSFLNLLDTERMSYLSRHDLLEQFATDSEVREYDMKDRYQAFLDTIAKAQAVVEAVARDISAKRRRALDRKRGYHVYIPREDDLALLWLIVDKKEAGDPLYHLGMNDKTRAAYARLAHLGLAYSGNGGVHPTARGCVVAGSEPTRWRIPRTPDPPAEGFGYVRMELE